MNFDELVNSHELYVGGRAHPIVNIGAGEYSDELLAVRYKDRYGDSTSIHVNRNTLVVHGYEGDDSANRIRLKSRSQAKDIWWLRGGNQGWGKESFVDLKKFDNIALAKDTLTLSRAHAVEGGNPTLQLRLRKDIETSEVYDFDKWAEFRFASGEWLSLPWADEPWFKGNAATAHHFAHMSVADKAQVAFWSTEGRAQLDRVDVMTAGRYLNSFFSEVLTPQEIQQWTLRVDPPGELVFSGTSEDEIYEAYGLNASNSHSCMVYRDHAKCHDGIPWRSGVSPIRAYAGGDLEVANLMRHGVSVARGLVWREKKAYGRVYGDVERFTMAIEAMGYEHDGNGSNNMDTCGKGLFNGARMKVMVPEGYKRNLTAPYVDFGYHVLVSGTGCKRTMTLERHDGHAARRTDGLLWDLGCEEQSDQEFHCDRCEEDCEGTSHDVDGSTWCDSCAECHGGCCDRCNTYTRHGLTDVQGGGGWCDACLGNAAISCDTCGDHVRSQDINSVLDHRDGSHDSDACDSCAGSSDAITQIGSRYYTTDTIETDDEDEEELESEEA